MSSNTARAVSQAIMGLAVVAFGVLLLLHNLGYINFRIIVPFWPVLFIITGVSMLIEPDKREGRFSGLAMIAAGSLLILKHLGLIYLSWSVVWPVILIAVGGLILFRTVGGGRARARANFAKPGATVANTINATAMLGGVQQRMSSADFRGGEISAIFGGCEIDLGDCSLTQEAVINVFAVCGGISIKVPSDWTVILDCVPIAGGFSQKTAVSPDASKRLVITGHAIMGGLEIKS